MTIRQYLDLFVDDSRLKVIIFNLNEGNDVFEGYGDEIPYDLEDKDVVSLDITSFPGGIAINIESE